MRSKIRVVSVDEIVNGGDSYAAYEMAAIWFYGRMLENQEVMDYIKDLGISDEDRDKLQIGYFPKGRKETDAFVWSMVKRGIPQAELERLKFATLKFATSDKDRMGFYSAYSHRIIVPIRGFLDQKAIEEGKMPEVIGFIGVAWAEDDKERSRFYCNIDVGKDYVESIEELFTKKEDSKKESGNGQEV